MFVKLPIKEQTKPQCMSLSLLYTLGGEPSFVDALPPNVEANKQVRIPNAPALNEMFGLMNACDYDYYFDCGDADKETVVKAFQALELSCGGEPPVFQADEEYLMNNKNLIVQGLDFTIKTIMANKEIDVKLLPDMITKELESELERREKEAMKKFFSQMLFGDSKKSSGNKEDNDKDLNNLKDLDDEDREFLKGLGL